MQHGSSGEPAVAAQAAVSARGRERRPSSRYDDTEEEPAPKKPRKAAAKRSSAAAQPVAAGSPTEADYAGMDEKEAKRQRRLEQNRIAAKKAYNKRVKRQAEMESEYEQLRQELEATEAEAATLGSFLPPQVSAAAVAGVFGTGEPQGTVTYAGDGHESAGAARPCEVAGELDAGDAERTPPVVPPTSPASAQRAAKPTPAAGSESKMRSAKSIEALTSLVSMTESGF